MIPGAPTGEGGGHDGGGCTEHGLRGVGGCIVGWRIGARCDGVGGCVHLFVERMQAVDPRGVLARAVVLNAIVVVEGEGGEVSVGACLYGWGGCRRRGGEDGGMGCYDHCGGVV